MDFLNEVEKRLDLPRGEKTRVMAELETHWMEVRDELIASGTNPALAGQQAGRRLGAPEDVAARLSSVHNSATWKSALLAAAPVPALLVLVFSQPHKGSSILSTLPFMILFGVLLVGSVRELMHGRRTIWLASWLGASFVPARHLSWHFYYLVSENVAARIDFVICVVIAACLVAGVWSNRKWRIAAIALGVAGPAFLCLYPHHGTAVQSAQFILLVLGINLAEMALVTLFAWQIFARHSYGNAAQAALFAIAYFGFGFSMGLSIWLIIGVTVMQVVLVILFARSPKLQHKIMAGVAFGYVYGLVLAARALIYHSHLNPDRSYLALGFSLCATAAVYAILYALPVVTPFAIDMLGRRKERMQIAE